MMGAKLLDVLRDEICWTTELVVIRSSNFDCSLKLGNRGLVIGIGAADAKPWNLLAKWSVENRKLTKPVNTI